MNPTNSIDSELEAILIKLCHKFEDRKKDSLNAQKEALQVIKSLYISRKEVEEAIGPDTTDDNLLPELVGTPAGNAFKLARNSLRGDIRAKLLPPNNTLKGGKE